MKHRTLNAIEEEYAMRFGGLPNTTEALLDYAKKKYPFTPQKLEEVLDRVNRLEWESQEFTLFLIPRPTPRPRTDGHHFYVKGAAENKALIKKYIDKNIHCTRTAIEIIAYLPIPTSVMNHAEIYVAEAGEIVPITMGDVDNLMKTYLDMITGHLLLDDNQVSDAYLGKRYSLKPRLVVTILYQTDFDCHYNEKRVTTSTKYQASEKLILSFNDARKHPIKDEGVV